MQLRSFFYFEKPPLRMMKPDMGTPKDNCNIVYASCLLLGTGVLLSYNLLITCADYFTAEFPDHEDIMFYIVPAVSVTQVLTLVLMILYGHRYSFTVRIVTSFISSSVAVGIVPLSVAELTQSEAFWIVLGISSFIGITQAVLQSSIIGFCNFLPSSYIQLSMAGQAVSGITACTIRIITKFYDIYGGISATTGGLIYFVTGAVFNALCAVCFIYAFKAQFTQYWLQKNDDHDEALLSKSEDDESMIPTSETSVSNNANDNSLIGAAVGGSKKTSPDFPRPKLKDRRTVSYKAVFLKIWRMALAVFLVFYVTLLIFPGLLSGIESQYKFIQDNQWMPVILVVTLLCIKSFE